MQDLNIVELIEKNPITKLSTTYNSKLLNKIKDNFTGFEQQLFQRLARLLARQRVPGCSRHARGAVPRRPGRATGPQRRLACQARHASFWL